MLLEMNRPQQAVLRVRFDMTGWSPSRPTVRTIVVYASAFCRRRLNTGASAVVAMRRGAARCRMLTSRFSHAVHNSPGTPITIVLSIQAGVATAGSTPTETTQRRE